MGNITGAMVFQSTIPTVVALVFASSTWVVEPGTYVAFASAGIAFLSIGGDLHPDGPARRAARPGPAGRRRLLPGLPRPGRRRSSPASSADSRNGPLIYSADRSAGARPHADREDRRRTRAGTRTMRRPPGSLDDLDLLLRGRVRPDARRQGQHHDPRVHVRDGDVRGHPRLLERGAGQALRPEAPRARRADPPVVPDPADGGRPVGRRADPPDRRDGPPQRLPRGRLHPAVVLQVDLGDRRPAPRPRERAVHHRAARSGTTSTPNRASG